MDMEFVVQRMIELENKKKDPKCPTVCVWNCSHNAVDYNFDLTISEFLRLCEYFEIEPDTFFSEESDVSSGLRRAMKGLKQLKAGELEAVIQLIELFDKRKDG